MQIPPSMLRPLQLRGMGTPGTRMALPRRASSANAFLLLLGHLILMVRAPIASPHLSRLSVRRWQPWATFPPPHRPKTLLCTISSNALGAACCLPCCMPSAGLDLSFYFVLKVPWPGCPSTPFPRWYGYELGGKDIIGGEDLQTAVLTGGLVNPPLAFLCRAV